MTETARTTFGDPLEAPPVAPPPGDSLIMAGIDPTIAAIEQEISERIEAQGSLTRVFNDLLDNFPGGRRRVGKRAESAERYGLDVVRQWNGRQPGEQSERMTAGVTYRQFYAYIDNAIREAAQSGVDSGHLEKLNMARTAALAAGKPDDALDREIAEYVRPVYIRLRLMDLPHSFLVQ